jgi:hypothetical protein
MGLVTSLHFAKYFCDTYSEYIMRSHGRSGHGGEPTVDAMTVKVSNKLRGNGH